MILPSATTTAPTIGFGAVCPHPSRASASARRMYSASDPADGEEVLTSPSLPGETDAERPVNLRASGATAGERVVRVHCPAADRANLADEFEHRQVEREIEKVVRSSKRLLGRGCRDRCSASHREAGNRR